MNILMLFVTVFLVFSGISSTFAKEESKDHSKPVVAKIQYPGGAGSQPENSSGSNSVNRYGDLPNSYGGFWRPREILRNRFRGSDGDTNGEDRNNGYSNDQSTGGTSNPYPNNDDENEIANGVFSNPFLGQRRTSSTPQIPIMPSYGSTENGAEPGYGGGSYLGGRYSPNYGSQPGIYSSSGFRPGADQGYLYPPDQGYIYPSDQGYIYPIGGAGGSGVGLRQPNYPNGYGIGNGYGVYPGIIRNIPTSYVPSDGGSGIYREIPRSYGPALFGYGRYPELAYPGVDLQYGRLNESSSHGDKADENVARKSEKLPYPRSTPSSVSPKEQPKGKTISLRKEDP